jgi:hypothetical protein
MRKESVQSVSISEVEEEHVNSTHSVAYHISTADSTVSDELLNQAAQSSVQMG